MGSKIGVSWDLIDFFCGISKALQSNKDGDFYG
jgi:hypothetical protein